MPDPTGADSISQRQRVMAALGAAGIAVVSALALNLTSLPTPAKSGIGSFILIAAMAILRQRMAPERASTRYWIVMLTAATALGATVWIIAAI
jgi:hypothetical protein